MVPEFDQAAFALEPGQISDLVKTQYRLPHHQGRPTRRPATTRTLDDVRQQLTDQLAFERAQTQAADLAATLEGPDQEAGRPRHGGDSARPQVQESGFFARDEPILGARRVAGGRRPRVRDEAGRGVRRRADRPRLRVRDASPAKQDPYVPKLDEVKERVRDEVVKQKARELSRQKAAELAAKLKIGAGLREGRQGRRGRSQDDRADDARLADSRPRRRARGHRRGVQAAAGAVSDPIPTDNGTAIIKVLEKQEVTPDGAGRRTKDRFREELLTDRRNRFFSAYMAKAKQKMKIEVNREVLQSALGRYGKPSSVSSCFRACSCFSVRT